MESFRETLNELVSELITLIILNFLWLLCSLPIVTAVPAVIALFFAVNELVHGKDGSWRVFFQGFRRYFWKSWRWGLPFILIIVVILSNIYFYGNLEQQWASWARIGFVGVLLLWLALQIYVVPLLLEQDEFLFRQALRNCLALWFSKPVQSLGIVIVIALVVIASTLVVPMSWLFLTMALIAWLANKTTFEILKELLVP